MSTEELHSRGISDPLPGQPVDMRIVQKLERLAPWSPNDGENRSIDLLSQCITVSLEVESLKKSYPEPVPKHIELLDRVSEDLADLATDAFLKARK